MSDATTHLLLPYILAAQGQKHVTHNEALRILDGLVQLSVLDRDLTAPPGSPADGDRYIVGSGATGDWAGWDLNVALWTDGAWLRLPPRTGWRAWIEDEALLLVYDGAGWIGTTPAALQNLSLLGVGGRTRRKCRRARSLCRHRPPQAAPSSGADRLGEVAHVPDRPVRSRPLHRSPVRRAP
jgi:hypothetical protein